jgi:hypothetical protein
LVLVASFRSCVVLFYISPVVLESERLFCESWKVEMEVAADTEAEVGVDIGVGQAGWKRKAGVVKRSC